MTDSVPPAAHEMPVAHDGHRPSVRKVVLAGCVGIFVELYDNGVFAFMATALAIVFFDAFCATHLGHRVTTE